ncbi:Protein trichome birefringence-like [Seminavis robusta]|uniref:Protein trichome birefringence-like n=1 Tax=Seminavis robusta TaxID=568900 RepID=A0A9N8D9V3_9STRA|nr:Protein trichome birefringence-like [Seminavis robusta]|eukprot:Sro45_g026950.1 Protein trichome birefringence-like (399) ;mRNA; r:78816-80012
MMFHSKYFWLPGILLLVLFRMPSDDSSISSLTLLDLQKQVPEPPVKKHSQSSLQEKDHAHSTPKKTLDNPEKTGVPEPSIICQDNDEITHGQWRPVTLPRSPYMPMSPRVRCLPSSAFSQPFDTWEWQPSSCQLVRFDKQEMIRLLHNQTVLFVGDSLSLEHYASLVHLLGERARLPPKAIKHGRIQRHICTSDEEACMDLVFSTDFYLQNMTHALFHTAKIPRVLVLNRGAHYTPDDELMDSLRTRTWPVVQQWNDACRRQHYPQQKCLLIWRTTVPGHPHCHNFSQPATSVHDMQEWIHEKSTNDPTVYRKGEYHWQDFQRQNQLVTHWIQQPVLSHTTIHIMDSYQTNILRPDNHRAHMNDCLHSCSPGGGSDLNSQWLFHIIRVQEWQQQQQRL